MFGFDFEFMLCFMFMNMGELVIEIGCRSGFKVVKYRVLDCLVVVY